MRCWTRTGGILTVLLLAGTAGAQDTCRTTHELIGEHPSLAHTIWSRDLQGISHDDENWYITNVDGLYRIPASVDLARVPDGLSDPTGWIHAPIPADLAKRGYNHFGDLSWYHHDGDGYLCVPIENGAPEAVLAFFRASDLAYLHHAPLPGSREFAPLCAIDRDGHVVLPVERGVPTFRRYRVDWHGVTHARPGTLTPVGEIQLWLEDGSEFDERNFGGAAFSAGGRLLYVLTGYFDDHACPFWSARFWAGGCALDPDLGGIHVFDVRDPDGGVCRGSSRCDAVRIEKSHNTQALTRGTFLYRYRGTMLRGEEPEGITVWDLDSDGAPQIPGVGGQVHALMLDNELPSSSDLVSLRHYRAQVECPPAPVEKAD